MKNLLSENVMKKNLRYKKITADQKTIIFAKRTKANI